MPRASLFHARDDFRARSAVLFSLDSVSLCGREASCRLTYASACNLQFKRLQFRRNENENCYKSLL